MENEIKKLKELIEKDKDKVVVYRQNHSIIQPHNYRSMQ